MKRSATSKRGGGRCIDSNIFSFWWMDQMDMHDLVIVGFRKSGGRRGERDTYQGLPFEYELRINITNIAKVWGKIGISNSNSKTNFNGTTFGEPIMEKSNIVATTDILGHELLANDMSTSQATFKALRFAKIVQDKKSISKIKERDTGKISGRIKKRGKSKVGKNNIEYDGDDDQLCSLSQGNSENDESVSMYSIGASLGITLDGKSDRSNIDVFSDFLSELSNNERLLPPL
ncbi:hypothetical protein Tco_0605843 [Tanacetum coccineum]